jgi:actin-related protein
MGIQHLIQSAIQNSDQDIRAALLANVVVSGGNTLIPGFLDRLQYELSHAVPGVRVKVQAAANTAERRFSSWIGGSILASLGTFHQAWISKKEYEEHGSALLDRKLF